MVDNFKPTYPGEVDPSSFLAVLGEGRKSIEKPTTQPPKVQESVESSRPDMLVEAFRTFLKAGDEFQNAGKRVLAILERSKS